MATFLTATSSSLVFCCAAALLAAASAAAALFAAASAFCAAPCTADAAFLRLPLGLDSDSQGLVGNAPRVVVPDAGGQELIKDVGQVSMAATKAGDDIERSGSRLLIKGELGGRQQPSPLLGQMLVSRMLEVS